MLVRRERNQRGEGGRLKDELIAAAMRILDRTPGTQLSLRMVAREAGVAAPSIYPHFSDVRELMSAIVRECWRQLGEDMRQAAEEAAGKTARDILKAKMSAFVRYAMDRQSRYQMLFAAQPFEPETSDTMDGFVKPVHRQVYQSIEEIAQGADKWPAGAITAASLVVISLAHGRIALAHLAPFRFGNSPAEVERFVLEHIDRFFD